MIIIPAQKMGLVHVPGDDMSYASVGKVTFEPWEDRL